MGVYRITLYTLGNPQSNPREHKVQSTGQGVTFYLHCLNTPVVLTHALGPGQTYNLFHRVSKADTRVNRPVLQESF